MSDRPRLAWARLSADGFILAWLLVLTQEFARGAA